MEQSNNIDNNINDLDEYDFNYLVKDKPEAFEEGLDTLFDGMREIKNVSTEEVDKCIDYLSNAMESNFEKIRSSEVKFNGYYDFALKTYSEKDKNNYAADVFKLILDKFKVKLQNEDFKITDYFDCVADVMKEKMPTENAEKCVLMFEKLKEKCSKVYPALADDSKVDDEMKNRLKQFMFGDNKIELPVPDVD